MIRTLHIYLFILFLAGLIPFQALPVTSQYFEVNSFDEFNQGEMEFAVISSRGEIHPGLETREWETEFDGIWDILMLSPETLLIATGNQGKLLRFQGKKFSEEFDTGKLAVTALATDAKGNVYFSAIPDAVIYKRDTSGKVSSFAELELPYVWCLVYDPSRGLIAGTGPEGKIIEINENRDVKELLDTKAEHVMCLVLKNGILYAGTANPGMLIKISANGDYRVEKAFDEDEVRRVIDLSIPGDDVFVVAVNSQRVRGPRAPAAPAIKSKGPKPADGQGEEDEDESLPGVKKKPSRPGIPGKLNSAVYKFRGSKGIRNLLTLKGAAILDLAADSKGNIYAATDQQGKVYMIEKQDNAYEVAFDFKPEQVLSLAMKNDGLLWIGTGMPGALEKVSEKRADNVAAYFSEVFDAGFLAQWGRICHEPETRLIKFATRSGNTPDPDESWSKWDLVGLVQPFQIKSPDARYLQIKVSWPLGSNEPLSSFRAAYTILNQPHYIKEVTVLAPGEKPGRVNGRKPGNAKDNSSQGGTASKKGPSANSKRTIIWKVENPDKDELTFELFYKPEGKKQWIPFPLKKELVKTRFEWNTESIPDGYYRVKVRASDATANQPGDESVSQRASDPFLIDNRRPEITELKVSTKGRVSGKAKDSMSQITRLEYSLDGADWVFFMPQDRVFDEKHESFDFALEPIPEPGLHTISVRAFDRAQNLGAKQTEFSIK